MAAKFRASIVGSGDSPSSDVARRWLFDELLPFWCDTGFDRETGAFIEQLAIDGSLPSIDFKRVRVQARQIYVYSQASVLGFRGPALECAMSAFEFLRLHAWLGEQAGWGRTMGAKGGLRDATPDLYDNAFVLFGLAWLYRATQDPELRDWIYRTGDAIERVFADSGSGGYWHARPASGWREQNPHMHLLEAQLAAAEATQDGQWLARAEKLVEFAKCRFFDPETATLAEFYAADWSRAPGEPGHRIEPGHHFEWVWLLDWYARLRGVPLPAMADALFEFAERHGVDRTSRLTYDAVSPGGVQVDPSTRCWPQCETLKARLALGRRYSDPTILHRADQGLTAFLNTFVAQSTAGTWIEHLDANGQSKATRIPASSIYHIVSAMAVFLGQDGVTEAKHPP